MAEDDKTSTVSTESPVETSADKPDFTETTDDKNITEVDTKPTPTTRRKKTKRSVPAGQVHILATFNNTVITFTDSKGNVLTASSAGACGFRGSKKGTAYAAQVAAERAAQAAKQQYSFKKADVFIKGVGLGRDAAVRALGNVDINVDSICDVTGVPHGGVRPRKARRI